jgi:RimJ/RimL family protein N-acetyltransferase
MQVELIKPFPFESLPRVWKWCSDFRQKVADDFGPKTMDEFITHMRSVWDRQKSWAIYNDGELGGLITFERVTPWLGTAHVLLKPDFQGKGIAVQACRQAVGEMFEEGIGKLSFYPLGGNLAIGSLLVNIGAKREGTLEGQTLSNGKPIDIWMYGLTKEKFVAAPARRLGNRDEEKNHANGSNHSIAHRGGGLDRGLVPVREAEDDHHNEQPGVAGDHNREPVDTAHILA